MGKYIKIRFLLIFSFLLFGLFIQAQTVKPIRWTFSLSKTEVKQGETIEIIMKAEINPDWYLYSSDFDPDLGPTVSTLELGDNGHFKVVGTLRPIGAKEKYDSLWGGKIRYFTKHAEFRQKIKILNTNPIIKGALGYQVCSDKEGKCIPYEEFFTFDQLKVIAAEITPVKNPIVKEIPKDTATSKTPTTTKNSLSELEAEKEKLTKKDNKGKDIVIEQLKTFTQKYGGDK